MPGLLNRQPTPRIAPSPLEACARRIETGAPVSAIVAEDDSLVSAHGDGALRVFRGNEAPRVIGVHDGVVLSMCLDRDRGAVLTGGDDAVLARTTLDGRSECLASFDRRWVDHVIASRASGARACSAGRTVHVWRRGARAKETLEHPSTVGGLAMDASGRRMAVAHYGGVTVHARGKRAWRPVRLPWAGSHIGVTFSPDGRFVVSSMQENALHGWRLSDRADLRMAGYPSKVHVMRWVGDLPWLATSGAGYAVAWPFDGRDGPMGRAPRTLAEGGDQVVTCIAGLPGADALFAGFEDGAVLFTELDGDSGDHVVRGSTGSPVTAIGVTADLGWLLIGDEAGRLFHARLRADQNT